MDGLIRLVWVTILGTLIYFAARDFQRGTTVEQFEQNKQYYLWMHELSKQPGTRAGISR